MQAARLANLRKRLGDLSLVGVALCCIGEGNDANDLLAGVADRQPANLLVGHDLENVLNRIARQAAGDVGAHGKRTTLLSRTTIPTAPEVGVDRNALDALANEVRAGKFGNTHAILVAQRGRLSYEAYFNLAVQDGRVAYNAAFDV